MGRLCLHFDKKPKFEEVTPEPSFLHNLKFILVFS